jgi:arsenite oxidase small subunit
VTNIAEASTSATVSTFPKVLIANVGSLQVNTPVSFNYPLDDEPNLLVKVGQKAVGGVGPDGDIVAFSNICQHLGCIYGFQAPGSTPPCNSSFVAKGPMGYCCCHGSQYDFLNAAAVIGGPAPRPVPAVTLEVDSSGNIYATGMGPPSIFGHDTGSSDVTADLQGGNLVTSGSTS